MNISIFLDSSGHTMNTHYAALRQTFGRKFQAAAPAQRTTKHQRGHGGADTRPRGAPTRLNIPITPNRSKSSLW